MTRNTTQMIQLYTNINYKIQSEYNIQWNSHSTNFNKAIGERTTQNPQTNLHNMKSIWQRPWIQTPCGTQAMKTDCWPKRRICHYSFK